jgi:hypothetical protein
MENRKPGVLLIGESRQGSSELSARMERLGCQCRFVSSCWEAQLVVRSRAFDLVLGPTRLPDGSLYSLMNLLEGSGASMFYSFAVEYGCWWLPALRRGQECFGSPALRSSEFMSLLNEMIRELREVPMAPEKPPLPTFREELCRISPIGSAKERLVIVKRRA